MQKKKESLNLAVIVCEQSSRMYTRRVEYEEARNDFN